MSKLNKLLAHVVLGLAAVIFSVAPAEAATLTVTSAANSGTGSLRAIVGSAGDGDVIVFDDALSTITLTSQIELTTSLTIQGPNPDLLTISGGFSSRIFYINGSGKSVTLAGIRFLNGRSEATPILNQIAGGGAIFHALGILNINECEFQGNVTDDGNGTTSFGYGGAIMSQSDLHISNSTFLNNSLSNGNAYGGGAVYVQDNSADHDVSFNNCTFYNNSVLNGNAAATGGAIYIAENISSGTDSAPLVEITNCTFYSNDSNNDGEDLTVFSDDPDVSLTLRNNIFDRNAADGNDMSIECFCSGGVTFVTNGGNIYWDTPDTEILTNGTRDQVAQGLNGAGLTGSLALNGGGLRTIAILNGTSLADDNGVAGGPTLSRDARDFAREGNPDAGAFEFDGTFTYSQLTPEDNATAVDIGDNLIIAFEHDVTAGPGSIQIKRTSDNAVVKSIVASGAQVTGSGTNEITINPASDLPTGTDLYVEFPAGIFTAVRGEDIRALTGSSSWNFTTAGLPNTAPTISTSNTVLTRPADQTAQLFVNVADAETATSSLVLSAASSDISVVPTSSILQVGPTSATTMFNVSCANPEVGGLVDITLSVRDTGGSVSSTTFQINFLPVEAKFLAFSDQNTAGVDQVNGGNLTITNGQIFNFNFGTFSDANTLKATSATAFAMDVQRYGQVTLRVLDSPFPSDPSIKPTISGVGGVWASGPAVTSTSAVVWLSSSNPIRTGAFQMSWLGSSATVVTLRLTAGGISQEGQGSLSTTEVTLTINPSPPTKLAWSTSAPGDDSAFNTNDQAGLGNRFVLQVGANSTRLSSPIVSELTTFNNFDAAVPVQSPTATEYTLFTGFGGSSVPTPGTLLRTTSPTTDATLQISLKDKFARGAFITAKTTDNSLTATSVIVTLLLPKATQLGLSSTLGNVTGAKGAGIGIDGFNGGVTSLQASTSVNVTLSSYDDANYLTATGNNTFPVFFFTTGITASVDNPNVTLSGSTTFSLSPIVTSDNGTMTIDYTGSVVTTAVITFRHDGPGSMASTSVTVTLTPSAPDLDDFTPKFGPVGTEVTITGERLGDINEVLFNGVSTNSITIDSQTQIRAIVPGGAVSGLITISGSNGSDVSDEQFGVTTSATFSVVEDAYVDSGNPLTNYGSNASLKVRLLNQSKITFLKFAVGNVTTSIVTAKLRMFRSTASSSASQLFSVSNDNQNNQPWSEGSLNFNNAPTVPGTVLASSTASAGGVWLEFDVLSVVGGNGSFSFALQNTGESDVNFNSSEANSKRPELIVVDADGNKRVYLPTDDAWVFGTQPFNNYGNLKSLKTRTRKRSITSYLKFNTDIVQSPVLSSTLVLESRLTVNNGGKVFSTSNDFQGTSTPWTQTGLIFDNAPAVETAQRADIGSATAGGIELLSLAGGVNPGDKTSFAIRTEDEELANYYSSESSGNAPQLVVTWLISDNSASKSSGSDRVQSQRSFEFNKLPVSLLPNPTAGETSIVFSTLQDGPVTITIHDVRGAVVAQIHNGFLRAGAQRIDWNANSVSGAPPANGVYVVHVNTIDGQGTANLILQR